TGLNLITPSTPGVFVVSAQSAPAPSLISSAISSISSNAIVAKPITSTPPPKRVSVIGNILNSISGNAAKSSLSDWIVDLYEEINGKDRLIAMTHASKSGGYAFRNLAAGTYHIHVMRSGPHGSAR